MTVLEVVSALERELGVTAEIDWQPEQTGDVHRTWGDISAARAALGYQPVIGFDEGLRRMATNGGVSKFRAASEGERRPGGRRS